MKVPMMICVAVGVVLAQVHGSADTGFLDRSVTLSGVVHRYQVYVPLEHSRDRSWPVVVDLHQNGMQGSDGLLQTRAGLAEHVRRQRARVPAVVVFPQSAVGKQWLDADMQELVVAELDRTMSEFGGDPARVYLTGFSMGATGVYRIASRWPNRFAAVAAIAGRVDTSGARDQEADRRSNPFAGASDPFAALAGTIKHLPIRIFHGDADESVAVEQSRRLSVALKAAGANLRYDEYPGATHAGAAEKAYADEEFFMWLLAQRR